MSKKGQDNQRGISFQNKIALLYMLDNYKYSNFLKIKLEGTGFEDFTLFFSNINNNTSFFYEFEVKSRQKPLKLTDIRHIIKKEVEKGVGRYSDEGSFYIVAPSFNEECKKQIKTFKDNIWFSETSYKDFDSIKKTYEKWYGEHPILQWSKEEILFIKQKTEIVELSEKSTYQQIQERFYYEQPFFYTKDNAQNIIARLFKKVTEASSAGGELTKQKIEKIITEFCTSETDKSESYSLEKDLGSVVQDIEKKLETEDEFAKLNDSKYITPISKRERAVFYIADKLKEKTFKFKKIKWFFDKLLIKDRYMLHSLALLKQYATKENLDQEDKTSILCFINKIYDYESNSSSFYKHRFDNFYKNDIFTVLLNLSKSDISDDFKIIANGFLNKVLPDWEKIKQERIDYYTYKDVPKIIKNVLGYTKEGIELAFKKYNFTGSRDHQGHIYNNYIEEFINKDFKTHFPIVVKDLIDQFATLYKSYGYDDYSGYELSGGGYFGSGGRYNLQYFKWELLLSNCIIRFYDKTKDWEFLKSIIDSSIDKKNPVFVKRSFISFLLRQLHGASEKQPKENKFYKALESILDIKDGLPRTEDVVIDMLYKRSGENIPDVYLNLIIRKILYKYSKTGISYNILLIQFLMQFIENGKLQFKEDLKRILLDKGFKSSHVYKQALDILTRKIKNPLIKEFFTEIKDKLDISQNISLLYEDLPAVEKLLNSSSKKDLDILAGRVEKDIWSNNHDFIKKILKLMEDDFEGFYKRSKVSERLMQIIARMPSYATAENILNNEKLAEEIIDMCVKNDTNLCGESKTLHEWVAIKGEESLGITTMRAHLCFSIDSYVTYYCQKTDKEALKKMEKAFSWIKILIDLDGSLANKIPDFPKPNYYLRYFALIPLTNLSYYSTRKNLNEYKPGLGDKIKDFAFEILEQTEREIETHKYNPTGLLDRIGMLFDIIRDLSEEEAKKVVYFIRKFNISEVAHLFIYYAIFREQDRLFAGMDFKSKWFKKELQDICKSQADKLKREISFIIYKSIENTNEETKKIKPNFDLFDKVKDYWMLLFQNINKDMQFSLIRTLAFVLDRDKSYYNKYKKYLFKLIEKTLENTEESDGYFLDWDETLQAVSKHNPDDLIEILSLFWKKGNSITGWFPFYYEVTNRLIPEIKKQRDKISKYKIEKSKKELKKYNISL